ncbi:MAG: hypothetical protein ABW168_28675 [Sedimenticola sp.]
MVKTTQYTVDTAAFEQQILANLCRFDLLALLRLLYQNDYQRVWFKSHDSLVSEARVIQRIEFDPEFVLITLNIGLLSAQSPFPDYFMKMRDTLMDKQTEFTQFIGYFDHVLIQHLIYGIYPQLNRSCFGHWPSYQLNTLLLTNVTTIRTLQLIFSAVYPEYQVKCSKNPHQHCQILGEHFLGNIGLGCSYRLGDIVYSNKKGILVWLDKCCDAISLEQINQRHEQHILPLLTRCSLWLDVRVRGVLKPLSIADTPLGYHPLQTTSEQGWVKLFYGQTLNWGMEDDCTGVPTDC